MYCKPMFPIPILELSQGDEIRYGCLRIKCFGVSHVDISSPGCSISNDSGQRVLISGDTRACTNLEREVAGADLALLECTYGNADQKLAEEHGHMVTSRARAIGRKARAVS